MLGRQRDRIAKTQPERLEDRRFGGAALGLVGEQDDRRVAAAQPARDLGIERGYARARVDHEQRGVGLRHRGLGLRAHPARKRLRIVFLIAGRVDDAELQPEQVGVALAPVARDTRTIVDQRDALADEAVEQCRLADIGAADDRDGRLLLHIKSPPPPLHDRPRAFAP